jgi:hypothetical protein
VERAPVQACEPASNVDQNFRSPPLFDQYVAAPVGVQSRPLFTPMPSFG